ncbi:hypothetical protein NP511_07170 [Natrinema thermotolerans]|uniref:Uncharacterized protein n=1 Tax=Natrinema thermotolerans TaxID=121872 RepID=A0AAF0T7F4_9EURY|nr:hypothetical protein [Natrinema thermotolerans]WMT09409.1 hypothetical protein NP511_07170 [Natrinema thermotolerans]
MEDDTEAVELFKEIKEMSFPDSLQNYSVEIQEDNVEESEIMISEDKLSEPDTYEYSSLLINMFESEEDEPPRIHFHPYIGPENFDDVFEFLSDVLGEKQINIRSIESDLHIENSPNDLNIIHDSADQVDLVGYRFDHDEDNYIVQESSGGSLIRASSYPDTVIKSEEIEEYISTNITKHIDFVEEVRP